MVNKKFESAKIEMLVRKEGTDYKFKRPVKNEFKEDNGYEMENGVEKVYSLRGIYHEKNSYVKVTINEGAQFRSKKIPTILCPFGKCNVIKGDEVKINGKLFKVTGIVDVQEWGIASDVCMEVVDDGTI